MTCQLLPILNNLLQRAMPYSVQLTILSHTLYKQIGLFVKFDVANIDNLLAVKTSCIVVVFLSLIGILNKLCKKDNECQKNTIQQNDEKESKGQYQGRPEARHGLPISAYKSFTLTQKFLGFFLAISASTFQAVS